MGISSNLKALLLGSIFLLPLLGPNKSFGYEQIKVLFFILSISLIGFFSLRLKFKWSLIAKAGGVFILTLLITCLTGIDPKASYQRVVYVKSCH